MANVKSITDIYIRLSRKGVVKLAKLPCLDKIDSFIHSLARVSDIFELALSELRLKSTDLDFQLAALSKDFLKAS